MNQVDELSYEQLSELQTAVASGIKLVEKILSGSLEKKLSELNENETEFFRHLVHFRRLRLRIQERYNEFAETIQLILP